MTPKSLLSIDDQVGCILTGERVGKGLVGDRRPGTIASING